MHRIAVGVPDVAHPLTPHLVSRLGQHGDPGRPQIGHKPIDIGDLQAQFEWSPGDRALWLAVDAGNSALLRPILPSSRRNATYPGSSESGKR